MYAKLQFCKSLVPKKPAAKKPSEAKAPVDDSGV